MLDGLSVFDIVLHLTSVGAAWFSILFNVATDNFAVNSQTATCRNLGLTFVVERLQLLMLIVKPLPEFTRWLEALPDASIRGVVLARIKRLSMGLAGDVAPIGEGVSELRIHVGAGWRVYFVQRGKEVIVLLAGGSKRTQTTDIKRAKALAKLLD